VLTGKYRTGTPADSRAASSHFAGFVGRHLNERSHRIVEAVVRAGEGLDWSPLEVALAWVRDRPGVTAPIVGARTAAQLKAALTVEECELPAEIIKALDDVSQPDPLGTEVS
jgi:aryl-alcohol dehydrogenase-like predicted oxidoreductase